MSSISPPFRLIEPAECRKAFLRCWLKERRAHLQLRSDPVEGVSESRTNGEELPQPSRFDIPVIAGDVRLLSGRVVGDYGLHYMAVLEVVKDDWLVLAAPFSPYSCPATKDEWQTPYEGRPVQALELWNVQPVPYFLIARSWRCFSMTSEELATARALYQHFIAGSYPPLQLRNHTGLPIIDPGDPRLDYQREEFERYGPLREAMLGQSERLSTVKEKESPGNPFVTIARTPLDFKMTAAAPVAPPVVAMWRVQGSEARLETELAGDVLKVTVFDREDRITHMLDGYTFALANGRACAALKEGRCRIHDAAGQTLEFAFLDLNGGIVPVAILHEDA